MKALRAPFHELAEFDEARRQLQKSNGIVELNGLADPQKSHMVYGFSDDFDYKIIATFSEIKARELYEDIRMYEPNALLFPAKDLIFYQADLAGNVVTAERMKCIKALIEDKKVTIVTTIDAFMARLIPLDVIADHVIEISVGDEINEREMAADLVDAGYVRNYQVEDKGQFSIRGDIIDIFPLTEDNPIRIELWGDDIESIRYFDIISQRSAKTLDTVEIYPASETVLSEDELNEGLRLIEEEAFNQSEKLRSQFLTEEGHRAKMIAEDLRNEIDLSGVSGCNLDSFMGYFYTEQMSLLDYIPKTSSVIFLDEPVRLTAKAEAVELEFTDSMQSRLEKGYALPKQTELLYSKASTFARLEGMRGVALCALPLNKSVLSVIGSYTVLAKAVNSYNNSFESLIADLKRFAKNKYRVILMSSSRKRAERIAGDLAENGLHAFYTENPDREVEQSEIMVSHGNLKRGFEYPLIKYVIISEGDIFTERRKKKLPKFKYEGEKVSSFTDLKAGDYVVHESHGLGIYQGIEKVTVDHVTKDYMKIEYRDGGNLYIPATALDTIQKYASGGGNAKPRLNKLGGSEWVRTKSKVKEAVDIIATDLVELYAARTAKQGYVYGEDTVWQTEFEDLFPFEETEDQATAIAATKADMQSTKIMDRLICGDVGYGKTEIAIRAAFKAVQENKQVVYLVPTTVLAQQHYTTFVQRMKDYPVRVDMMCRFKSAAEQKKTAHDLANGQTDIVIGTHRVLSSDVKFKDLGLLIIDEEQRFGVAHKEKIKKLKENVDVLTLTATPIPRTLHMSLIGIRDMSVLSEAPQDRMPIQTFVMEYNEEMVREAITRELARGGQVFYVYNRVQSIADMAAAIQRMLPDATIAFAHGQMKENELERIMYDFVAGDIDVLVSTTIIETGLDIPNVNTMIIHDADQLGLSQLYQLRGRVGRSNRTAYAFLMYKRNKLLKETAEKRLQAIRDFTELGSGFKIAMRDLEIRGAGNLLGERQSGHMDAVGYDMYCKLLNEAVKRKKGEEVEADVSVSVDVNVDAYIPDDYICNENQKMDVYKRIANISSKEEADDMEEELYDRFGSITAPVKNLITIAYLRVLAKGVYISEIKEEQNAVKLTVYEGAKYRHERIGEFISSYKGKLILKPVAKPYFIYKVAKPSEDARPLLTQLEDVLKSMEAIVVT